MRIVLKELDISNFKGLKNTKIVFGEKETNIYGANATGKTTIVDAFTWLLFDKDSTDRKQFEIKPIDKQGNVKHGVDVNVTAFLEIDGEGLILSKTFKEKWTKKRGEAEKKLTGHTTEYMINNVPVKKKDYQDKINSLIDENIFKLLTNPLYFNEKLHWQDRRKLLMEIAGEVSNEEIINTYPELQSLKSFLNQEKDMIQIKKELNASKKKINEMLNQIPVRIDEVEKTISEIEEIDFKALEKALKQYKKELKELEEETKTGTAKQKEVMETKTRIMELKNKLKEIEFEIEEKERKEMQQYHDLLNSWNRKKRELEQKYEEESFKFTHATNKIDAYLKDIQGMKEEIKALEEENKELRDKWNTVKQKQLIIPDKEFKCPTCGQLLPESMKEEKIEEMKQNFLVEKANELKKITEQGTRNKEKIEQLKQEIVKLETEIKKLHTVKAQAEQYMKDYKVEIDKAIKEINEITEVIAKKNEEAQMIREMTPEEVEIKLKIDKLEAKLKELQEENTDDKYEMQKTELQEAIEEINKQLAKKEQLQQAKKRIKELEEEERNLAHNLAEVERIEFQVETFIKKKVELMESKINNMFKIVKFKLFNELVNGAIEETCIAMVDGVPFPDLNNAMKINAGIDIINILSDYYNLYAPIFIDNRESVINLLETKSQLINLIVSEKHPKLTIEEVD